MKLPWDPRLRELVALAVLAAYALPLMGERRDKLDSDFDPTRHRHIAACPTGN
jgi:hypothetical protein